jgi:glutathione peroxidase
MRMLVALLFATPAAAFEFEAMEGGTIDLDALRGGPVMVVNTASLCGFVDQFADLQRLHDLYADQGLTVIGVPSDDFRQELGTDEEVAEFCEVNYGLTIPLTTITTVTGTDAHPFYAWLAEQGAVPRWNFNKALLSSEGELIAFHGANVRPTAPRLKRDVKDALSR